MYFKHFALMVRDLEKSIEFYETFTELTVARRYKDGEAELAFMTNAIGETEIELVSMAQSQKFEGKGFFLCFVTDNLDTMHKFAQDNGLNPSDIRNPDAKSRYFYLYDPDGVSVQLKQNL